MAYKVLSFFAAAEDHNREEKTMDFWSMHYFPLSTTFMLFLLLLVGALIILIEIKILGYAYSMLGIDRHYILALLFLSLLGSYVNIPIAQLTSDTVHPGGDIAFFGMRYVIPMVQEWPGTVIAVNVGGAIIPTLLSLHLLMKNRLYVRGVTGVAMVTVIVHLMAHPVKGVGIAEPTFIPPLVAAGVGLLLSRQSAPPLAYISGSLGTLIGADLLNLGKIQGLGAPIASIGGAGTFDGIFLTGIMAVLLAAIFSRKHRTS
jgi:uncharacterized membrane protein